MTNELIKTVLLWIVGGALTVGSVAVAYALFEWAEDGESEIQNRPQEGLKRGRG